MTDARIISLLKAAGIPSYYAGNWFLDCRLEKSVLLVPDQEGGQSIAKLFGQQLRQVIPDLVIRVSMELTKPDKSKPSILNAAGRKWQAKQARLEESE